MGAHHQSRVDTLGSAVPNHVDYIASKGGVVGFTRGLASELALMA